MLIQHPTGHYRFLKGIDPYSSGVIADPGYEIVHVTLTQPIPWREGLTCIATHLSTHGQERTALCGIQLRCPAPFTLDGFIAFNRTYCAVLQEWGLYVDGLNPVARTNVAPMTDPPEETMLYGFSYTRPCDQAARPTFLIAGAGELLDGTLTVDGIIRRGETHPAALREKAAYVVNVMEERLSQSGVTLDAVTRVNIYTVHALSGLVEDVVLPKLSSALSHGVHWYPSRPPIVEIEYEMDMRGVEHELYLDLRQS